MLAGRHCAGIAIFSDEHLGRSHDLRVHVGSVLGCVSVCRVTVNRGVVAQCRSERGVRLISHEARVHVSLERDGDDVAGIHVAELADQRIVRITRGSNRTAWPEHVNRAFDQTCRQHVRHRDVRGRHGTGVPHRDGVPRSRAGGHRHGGIFGNGQVRHPLRRKPSACIWLGPCGPSRHILGCRARPCLAADGNSQYRAKQRQAKCRGDQHAQDGGLLPPT